MQEKVYELSAGQWVDIIAPQIENVDSLADRYQIPVKNLLSCLDPEHLPKLEVQNDFIFLITRVFDRSNSKKGDTVQELTTKLSFFIFKDRVITIHRVEQQFIENLKEKLTLSKGCLDSKKLILELISHSILSFVVLREL